MRLIFLGKKERDFETDWLKIMLSDSIDFSSIEYNPQIFDNKNNETFLIISDWSINCIKFLDKCINMNFRFGLILLSDEGLDADLKRIISYKDCRFIARNYYDPRFKNNKKVWHFGLGFKNNFSKYIKKEENRDLIWFFSGNINKNRKSLINTFQHLKPHFYKSLSSFNSKEGLSTEKYCKFMNKSFFSLCPQGYLNNESFRLYESLISGTIPVCLKSDSLYWYFPSYWHSIFPNQKIPFIIGKNWEECIKEMRYLINSPEKLYKKRMACQDFIQANIEIWQKKFKESILELESKNKFQYNSLNKNKNLYAIQKLTMYKKKVKNILNLFKRFISLIIKN